MREKKRKKQKKLNTILFLCLSVFLLSTTYVIYNIFILDKNISKNNSLLENTNKEKKEDEKGEIDKKEKVETIIKLSAIGDCTLGNDRKTLKNNFNYVYDNNEPKYFFSGVVENLSKSDITVANLESPITESKKFVEKKFVFKGPPEYTKILKEGNIEVVNIANNHTYDYGVEGFEDTKRYLEQDKIEYFGYDKKAIVEKNGVKIGFLGYEGWDESKKSLIEGDIKALKEKVNMVIISFHWGDERHKAPNEIQKALGRASIDSGADLVLGHHPHVIQGIEKYNGKNIVYSLGNFCFGGNTNPADKDTFIYKQEFTFDENKKLIKISEDEKIPASISSSRDKNDYRPSILEGEEKERVAKKIEERSSLIK